MRRTSNIKTHLKFHESRNRETNELFERRFLIEPSFHHTVVT